MPVGPEKALIVGPDGEPLSIDHEPLSDDELRLLAEYKKFLARRQYREAVYCNRCFSNNLSDGSEFRVNTSGFSVEAMIKCRCRLVYGKGSGLPN